MADKPISISPRKHLEQRCWAALGPDRELVECFLQDVSHTGAKLVLETENNLSKTFDLYLTQDGRVGRNCKVVWQEGAKIGVHFVGRAVPLRTLPESLVKL